MIRPIAKELLQRIVEGALMAASKPLTVQNIQQLFDDEERPSKAHVNEALMAIADNTQNRGFELKEVASGWRFQVCQELSSWVGRLWEERPQKYSRALLETLSLVAYRQPITRGDIESIRGVAVSSNIMRTLLDRGWVKIIGHRDVPGRPAMYATTREFLDYFNLSRLDELPTLAEIRDLDSLNEELNLQPEDIGAKAQAEAEARNAQLLVDVAEPEPEIEREPVQSELIPVDVEELVTMATQAPLSTEPEPEPVESSADILDAVACMEVDDAFLDEDVKRTEVATFTTPFKPPVSPSIDADRDEEVQDDDFNGDALVHFSDDIDPAFLDEED